MKTEEVEMAAKRSPHTTTLKDCIIFQAGVEWANEYHKNNPDEYAEEYANAAIKHTIQEINKLMRGHFTLSESEEFFLQSFKESLKK